jgi:hypothetical protein
MYQRFIAVGRLGRDPEISTTAGGNRMASFSLATSEVAKGEERAEWHRVVVWDERLVDVIERRARKGTLVALEGQIRTRRWSGRDGKEITRLRSCWTASPAASRSCRAPAPTRKPWTPSRPTSRFSTSVSPSMNCRFEGCDIAFLCGDTILVTLRERSSAPGGSLTGGPLT